MPSLVSDVPMTWKNRQPSVRVASTESASINEVALLARLKMNLGYHPEW
jgi:hypothetical protein